MKPNLNPRKLGLLQVILLAIPCIAVLVVPYYNTLESGTQTSCHQ